MCFYFVKIEFEKQCFDDKLYETVTHTHILTNTHTHTQTNTQQINLANKQVAHKQKCKNKTKKSKRLNKTDGGKQNQIKHRFLIASILEFSIYDRIM
jgi:hypothetical protein